MGLPSKKTIADWFGDYFKHEGVDPKVGAAMVRKAMEEAKNPDDALNAVDALIKGHGIEVIRGEYYNNYYGDALALYINMGDTYAPTLLYMVRTGSWVVTSWGDWVERNERRYKIK